MARSVNKVILIGNVGKDPEVKFSAGGQAIAKLGLATTDRVKDKGSDQWQDKTDWHNLVAFGRTAEVIRDYVKKGKSIYVEGKLSTSSWDDKETGKKVYRTEVLVNELVLLGGRGEGEGSFSSDGGGYQRSNSGARNTASFDQRSSNNAPQDDYAHAEITDDDIPF